MYVPFLVEELLKPEAHKDEQANVAPAKVDADRAKAKAVAGAEGKDASKAKAEERLGGVIGQKAGCGCSS